ncbi:MULTISPECIES: PLD nuclease N-terminal domain-containing protein [unclassified Kribbella]|uniref:PLD nuclease N-terminal domain-containing protein n=1 Tax=unclassified Kribbella TaxID=2644121 RepID=UPI003793898B|nr:PLD nuclease N-terminal domain-containing protein [Kribbella sp. NBC_00889]
MVRFLPFLISLALSVYALFSCIQTPDEEVPHLPKLVWIVLIVFVPFVGPIVWLLMSRTQGSRREVTGRPPRPSARPVAPDDDPDFLKTLDRYRDPRTTVKPPHDDEPHDRPDDRPQDAVQKPEPKPEQPEEPETKPKAKDSGSETTPEAETTSEPDDGKA